MEFEKPGKEGERERIKVGTKESDCKMLRENVNNYMHLYFEQQCSQIHMTGEIPMKKRITYLRKKVMKWEIILKINNY